MSEYITEYIPIYESADETITKERIVRCRDCKNFIDGWWCEGWREPHADAENNGYCYKAEPKEGAE